MEKLIDEAIKEIRDAKGRVTFSHDAKLKANLDKVEMMLCILISFPLPILFYRLNPHLLTQHK